MISLSNIILFFKSTFSRKKNKSIEFIPIYVPLHLSIHKSKLDIDDSENSLTYCTICDLLHIEGYLYKHCNLCNKCHEKYKLHCNNCNNCYDYRNDMDIIYHRKNCISAYNI